MQFVKNSKNKDLIHKLERCKSPDELRKIAIDLTKSLDALYDTVEILSKEMKKQNGTLEKLEKELKQSKKIANQKPQKPLPIRIK
jgi:predicted RNase H-like nuclease (RuvC/YqgF family)